MSQAFKKGDRVRWDGDDYCVGIWSKYYGIGPFTVISVDRNGDPEVSGSTCQFLNRKVLRICEFEMVAQEILDDGD